MACQSNVPVNTLGDYEEIVVPGRANLPPSFNVFKALQPCNATGLHPHHHHRVIPAHLDPQPYPVMPTRGHLDPHPFPVMPTRGHLVPGHLLPGHLDPHPYPVMPGYPFHK